MSLAYSDLLTPGWAGSRLGSRARSRMRSRTLISSPRVGGGRASDRGNDPVLEFDLQEFFPAGLEGVPIPEFHSTVRFSARTLMNSERSG